MSDPITPSPGPAPPPAEPDDPFRRRTLGYLFAGVLAVFVGVFVYFTVAVVGPMTRPSPYFDKLTESALRQTADGKPDPLTVDLAVMLEYASADIRMAGVQVAFALVGGLFFAAVGVLLLAAQVSGAFKLGAKSAAGQFTLSTAAPGLACLTFGAVIIGLGVMRDVSQPFRGQIDRPTGARYQVDQKPPPGPSVEGGDAAVSRSEGTGVRAAGGPIKP